MFQRWYQLILVSILILLLTACSSPTPPRELAPDGNIVQKAIALQLQQTESNLVKQLDTSEPELEIAQIKVKELQPVFVGSLPTYHLQGTYNLILKLPRQKTTQKDNLFDIYVQRQIEGKTWRLLKKETNNSDQPLQWSSYLIR